MSESNRLAASIIEAARQQKEEAKAAVEGKSAEQLSTELTTILDNVDVLYTQYFDAEEAQNLQETARLRAEIRAALTPGDRIREGSSGNNELRSNEAFAALLNRLETSMNKFSTIKFDKVVSQ